jgi:DnaJ-class molecular chaperone
MPFPRPEDYRTHKGPKGSPAEWAAKAAKLLQSRKATDAEIFESLQVLGLSGIPTLTSLKQAYRKVSREVHPDRGGSHEGFIKARKAFDILSLFVGSKHV